jgi:hypothetical protein
VIRIWYYLWASPNTALGLAVAALSPRWRVQDGVLEVHGGLASWVCRNALIPGGASAMTLGHVVLGRDARCLERAHSHELVHVRQYERWGPLFIPAYLGCSVYLFLRGKSAYHDNPFEVEAYRDG